MSGKPAQSGPPEAIGESSAPKKQKRFKIRKKKVFITGAVLLLLVLGAFFLFVPAPIISSPDDAQIYYVCVYDSEAHSEDLTDRIDGAALARIISAYSRSRLPHNFSPHQITDGELEISCLNKHGSMHIILGDSIHVISGSGWGGYTIHDSGQLKRDILQIIQ